MLYPQHLLVASSLLLLLTGTSAFSARKASQLVRTVTSTTSSSSSSSLNVGAVWTEDDDQSQQQQSLFLISRAEACANSESCGLDEARTYLDEILHAQKECVGNMNLAVAAASNPGLCDNVDTVVEVVANLRQKIATEQKRLAPVTATVHLVNVAMGFYVVSMILHGLAAVPNVPVDAPLFDASSFGAINTRGVASILPQEWLWSIRDGYFPSLFGEWLRNGGLVVDVSAFDEKVVSFSPQEWVWSVQNGSLGQMMRENMRYGGLVVDAGYDTEGLAPMTPQELYWSIRDGYFGTAVQHLYRNGGV